MIKRYINKDIDWVFRAVNGFPSHCPECKSILEKTNDFNYNSEWTCSYICSSCKSKFAYQPSDMGQSLEWIERYDDKHEVFGDNVKLISDNE